MPDSPFFVVQTQYFGNGYAKHVYEADLLLGEWPDAGVMLRSIEAAEGFFFGGRWLPYSTNGRRYFAVYTD